VDVLKHPIPILKSTAIYMSCSTWILDTGEMTARCLLHILPRFLFDWRVLDS